MENMGKRKLAPLQNPKLGFVWRLRAPPFFSHVCDFVVAAPQGSTHVFHFVEAQFKENRWKKHEKKHENKFWKHGKPWKTSTNHQKHQKTTQNEPKGPRKASTQLHTTNHRLWKKNTCFFGWVRTSFFGYKMAPAGAREPKTSLKFRHSMKSLYKTVAANPSMMVFWNRFSHVLATAFHVFFHVFAWFSLFFHAFSMCFAVCCLLSACFLLTFWSFFAHLFGSQAFPRPCGSLVGKLSLYKMENMG